MSALNKEPIARRSVHAPAPWTWVETPSVHTLDYPHDAPDKPWDGRTPLGDFHGFDELRDANGEQVLVGYWCNDDTAEIGVDEADARLIAAAPDLLRTVRELLEACAAAMRVIAEIDTPTRLKDLLGTPESREQALMDELRIAGVGDGFGIRAKAVIAKAEGRSE